VHPVGSHHTNISRCTVHKTLNISSHHSLVVFDECISCLLVAFCAGSPWLIISRPVSNVCSSIFAVFYPMPPTAGTHANFSIKMTVSWQILQVNYSPLLEIQWQNTSKTKHSWQPFCHSSLWLHFGAHVLDWCFRSEMNDATNWYTAFTIMCNMMPFMAFSSSLV
jgi:hypothetical protein